jgi:hypothetical protein
VSAGQNGNIKICNKSSERVEQFRYFRTTLRIKIPFRKNQRAECYQGVLAVIQCKSLSFSLLSKHIKINMYRTTTLPVFVYGCETWLFIMKKEHGLKVFKNRVLRKIFGP